MTLSRFVLLIAACFTSPSFAASTRAAAPDAGPKRIEIGFVNGEAQLAGSLALPPGRGPFPAILIVAGSGAADRTGFGIVPSLETAFLGAGFAVFSWDKPGTERSSGDHRNQSIANRIDEVLAAAAATSARPEIRKQAIGLWGISQAGWVIPEAATRSSQIAFLISVSGPGGTGADQELYRVGRSMEADGYKQEDIEAALAFTRRRNSMLASGASFEAVDAFQRSSAGARWFREVGRYDRPSYERLRQPQTTPEPALERLTIPILAIYGERDRIVDWRQSARTYRRAAARAGNNRLAIVTFPAADHVIFPTVAGGQAELDAAFRNPIKVFAPGYLETMTNWAATVAQEHLSRPERHWRGRERR